MENKTTVNNEELEMKTKATLVKLLDRIQDAQGVADADLTDWDWRTRPAMQINKSEAKRSLAGLKADYLKEFTKLTAKVFVDGTQEQVNTIASLLQKEGATVITVPNIYQFLAENTAPKLSYGDAFSTSAWLRLTEILGDTCRTFDVYPHTPPKQPNSVGINNNEELVNVIKGVVRESFGDSLNKVYLTSTALNSALVNKFDKDVAIVILSGLNDDEKASLMDSVFPGQPNFSLSLSATEVPDKSTALKVYRRVYESFSKAKTKKEPTKIESHQ